MMSASGELWREEQLLDQHEAPCALGWAKCVRMYETGFYLRLKRTESIAPVATAAR